MRKSRWLYFTAFAAVLTAAAIGALFLSHPSLKIALSGLAMAGLSWCLGAAALPGERPWWQAFWGSLLLAASLAVCGSAMYYLHSLDRAGLVATLLLAPALPLLLAAWKDSSAENAQDQTSPAPRRLQAAELLTALASAILLAASCALIASCATGEAIRSPWEAVPISAVALFFFAAIGVVTLAIKGRGTAIAGMLLAAALLLSANVATFVYRAGYGFDPFLHRAAERIVAQEGAVTPKTPYYIGQYTIVAAAHHLTGIATDAIDRHLVPVIALLTLVPAALWGLRRTGGMAAPAAAGGAALLLVMPLAPFIVTTPQGLADVFILLAACAGLAAYKERLPFWTAFLLLAAAAAIHPLAGIPAFLAGCAIALGLAGSRRLSWTAAAVAAVSVPLMFLANGLLSGNGVGLGATTLGGFFDHLLTAVPARRFNLWLDAVYAWNALSGLVILTLAAAGARLLAGSWQRAQPWIVGLGALGANALLLKTSLHFPFLVASEQASYGNRLAELTVLAAVPLAAYAVMLGLHRLPERPKGRAAALCIIIAAAAASTMYLSYPRLDRYESSRGFSTSTGDIAAVRAIHEDGAGRSYVVLANQSTAAAAIQEFGFARYFSTAAGQLFYYPVPTTSPLASIFLAMNDEPSRVRELANQAMLLTGADSAYFVVTRYWWNAANTARIAERLADKSWSIDRQAWVFKFVRKY